MYYFGCKESKHPEITYIYLVLPDLTLYPEQRKKMLPAYTHTVDWIVISRQGNALLSWKSITNHSYFNTCTVHLLLFSTMTNKCTIISQIISPLHVPTLSWQPQGACN